MAGRAYCKDFCSSLVRGVSGEMLKSLEVSDFQSWLHIEIIREAVGQF